MVIQPNSYIDTNSDLDATFFALADQTRRAILARLSKGEASVQELALPFKMSQPAISKHLKVLERAGLISIGKEAQRRPRRIEAKPLADATRWLEKYRKLWEGNYRRLDDVLEEMTFDAAAAKRGQAKKEKGNGTKKEHSKRTKDRGKR